MTVRHAIAAIALPCIFFPPTASPQAASIDDVLSSVRRLRRGADFRAEGRLVHVDARGARTTYRFTCKGKSFSETFKLFWSSASLKLLMEASGAGRARIRMARVPDFTIHELKPEEWSEALFDSALEYEDLIDHHFSWGVQVLVGEEKYGARTCYVVRSQPGPGEPSTYSRVTSWIDKTIYVPVRVEKVVRASGATKHFVYYGLQQSRGVWGARQAEVRTEGNPALTYLIMTRGSSHANLGPGDFDPTVLMKHTQP
jgi:hypothetical protein